MGVLRRTPRGLFTRRGRVALVGLAALVAGAAIAATLAGRSAEPGGSARLTVFAAASLTEVLPKIDEKPKYDFAGSNTLLNQIEQGAPADVFASANTKYAQQLYDEGTCEQPVVYAENTLVVIVPKSNPAGIETVFDLTRPGVKVVIAGVGVPVGDYTRAIVERLGISKAVMANVVSNESDVKAVTSKVALGQADAGLVYRTDAVPVQRQTTFIEIPARAQPPIRYGMCVLKSSHDIRAARAFQQRVLGPIGRGDLSGALFGLPPEKK